MIIWELLFAFATYFFLEYKISFIIIFIFLNILLLISDLNQIQRFEIS